MKILKTYWIIFSIAILLRVMLSLTTYHSDIQAVAYGGQVIASGHVLDFYDYLYTLNDDDPILKVFPRYLFNYPPAIYMLYAIDTLTFLNITPAEVKQNFIYDIAKSLGNWQINLHLLLLKLPLFVFDIGAAMLLFKIFKDKKHSQAALLLWLFNPITLYGIYMMGQFDIIPTFFTILSIYFLSRQHDITRRNLILAAVALGLGGAFKIYPIFLIIPLISVANKWSDRILAGFTGIGVYILTILPFINSTGYKANALIANQTLKSLYAQIPVSGGESIMLFISLVVFLYLAFLLTKISSDKLWTRYFLILLVFFVFTHFHPQWLVWLSPFLIFELLESKFKTWPVIGMILFCFIGMISFFEGGLSVGLFAAVNPALFNAESVWKLLGLNLDVNYYRSILQSVFVGASLYYFSKYFSLKQD